MATLYSMCIPLPTHHTPYLLHHLSNHIPSHASTHTSPWAHLQLYTLRVLNMGTFDWLPILTMERGQWSSIIVALGGVAFVQTVTGALVRLLWHVGSWDMRQGLQ